MDKEITIKFDEQLIIIEALSYRVTNMEQFISNYPDTDMAKQYATHLIEVKRTLNKLMEV
jgi:hypothetical protein